MQFTLPINIGSIKSAAMVGMGVVLLSACNTQAQEASDATTSEATATAQMPVSQTVSIAETFKGFYAFEAVDDLAKTMSGNASNNSASMEETIIRVLDGLGYARIAAKAGVESQLHITVFQHGDFVLDYQLGNIQEDLTQARNLKVLFEKIPNGYAVKQMGVREKCVYGDNQTEWSMASCPAAPKILPNPEPEPELKPEPIPESVPETRTTEALILQDGVDAFADYKRLDIPKGLSGTYPNDDKAIAAFIAAFDLRKLANTEGVSAWAKIRTSKAGKTTWQYELTYLPDDSVYGLDYKIYLEKVSGGTQISRIGHRVKCYRGDFPKQWTVKLCP